MYLRPGLAFALALAASVLVSAAFAASPGAPPLRLPPSELSADQRVLHALDRLGYGPRPGQLEQVRAAGLEAWIAEQLDPGAVPDVRIEQRVRGIPTLRLEPIELLARYPPARVLREIEQAWTGVGLDRLPLIAAFPELADGAVMPEGRSTPDEAEAQARLGLALRRRADRIHIDLAQAKLLRAAFSERQLGEVLTDFWFNHFNVFIGKGSTRWVTADYERVAIRPHVLGRFRDLLGAVAHHPAMLIYLDNWISSATGARVNGATRRLAGAEYLRLAGLPPGGLVTLILRDRGLDTAEFEQRFAEREAALERRQRRRDARRPTNDNRPGAAGGLNENYARELLELHTVGVDGGYTQQDIIEIARCFTGWSLLPIEAGHPFRFMAALHDGGPRTILGRRIEVEGEAQGEAVLDLLARHPSTARFISTKLARRFVADDPPQALVERMARVFLESDGDLRRVMTAMVESPEFWSPQAYKSKLKTPFEYVVGLVRATGAGIDDLPEAAVTGSTGLMDPEASGLPEGTGLQNTLRLLGQPLYAAGPPTGFPDEASYWISPGSMLQRFKVATALVSNKIGGVRIDRAATVPIDPLEPGGVDRLARQLLGLAPPGEVIAALRARLAATPEELDRLGLPPRTMRRASNRQTLATIWLLSLPQAQRR